MKSMQGRHQMPALCPFHKVATETRKLKLCWAQDFNGYLFPQCLWYIVEIRKKIVNRVELKSSILNHFKALGYIFYI